MKKIKENHGKVSIPLLILIAIILIAGVILTLKITGVIEPKEPDINTILNSNTTQENEVQNRFEELENIYENTQRVATIISNVIMIGILVVTIGLNIGVCKLYKKLRIPNYIVVFNFLWPILNIINDFLPNELANFNAIIYSILQVMSLVYYFKAVGMSWFWGILPTVSTWVLAFGVAGYLASTSMFLFSSEESSGGGFTFLMMIGLVALIAYIVAYVISNIKLAKIFGKGTGFTVGLVLLPFIFQPILGYSNKETPSSQG